MTNISRATRILPLLANLENKFGQLTIVETGTIRNIAEPYKLGDGHSTLHIARWLKERVQKHDFYSVDLNVETSKQYLFKNNLLDYVKLVEGNSITFLQRFDKQIHLAYLDSANNANHIFKEFLVVVTRMVKGGIIVIDDAMPFSKEVVKIHKVLPYLKKHNFNHQIVGTQCVIKL